MINLMHNMNAKLIELDNETILVVLLVFFCLGSATFFIVSFVVFHCTLSYTVCSICLGSSVILVLFSVFIEDKSALTGSFVSLYIGYLTLMGLLCSNDCGSFGVPSRTYLLVISSIFTLVWLAISSFSLTTDTEMFDCDDDGYQMKPTMNLSFFHFTYACASAYLGCLITNWGDGPVSSDWQINMGSSAMWVNLGVAFATILVYGWTLAAPFLFPDRDFG